jgi:hypothetical protein
MKQKTDYFFMRMNPAHKEALRLAAAARGQTMTQYVYETLRIATMNFLLPSGDTRKSQDDTVTQQTVEIVNA